MNSTHRAKIGIIIAFLLSLLFHISSVLYILWQKNSDSREQSSQEKEEALIKEIKKREEWVETKARASNFGAPVMFQDEPSHQAEPIPSPVEEETTTPKEKTVEETVPAKMVPEEKSISLQELVKKTPIRQPKKSLAQQKKATAGGPVRPFDGAQDKLRFSEGGPKPPLSLAQLTQGFLNHVRDEGKHAIHMLGKKNGTPSDEQIKHERYLEKLGWCLQNSFNIHNNRFPRSATDETTVHILLSLNKDGTMKLCNVAKTSGNIQLDQFTLFVEIFFVERSYEVVDWFTIPMKIDCFYANRILASFFKGDASNQNPLSAKFSAFAAICI